MLESLGDGAGFSDDWNYSSEAIFRVGFFDGIFREGVHGMMVQWGRERRWTGGGVSGNG